MGTIFNYGIHTEETPVTDTLRPIKSFCCDKFSNLYKGHTVNSDGTVNIKVAEVYSTEVFINECLYCPFCAGEFSLNLLKVTNKKFFK